MNYHNHDMYGVSFIYHLAIKEAVGDWASITPQQWLESTSLPLAPIFAGFTFALSDSTVSPIDDATRSKFETCLHQQVRCQRAQGRIDNYRVTCDRSNNNRDVIEDYNLIAEVELEDRANTYRVIMSVH